LDEQIDEGIIKNFPLAEYAAEHWASHARFGNVSSLIKDGVDSSGKPSVDNLS